MNEKNSDYVYKPEGIEDLDIRKSGDFVEVIQVKNYKSGSIGYNDLSSKAHNTSFFKRGAKILEESPDVRLKLVSFGKVNKTLTDKNRLFQSLKRDGLKVEAKNLIEHFDIETVDEDDLYSKLSSGMKSVFRNANPLKEIRYLLQWISEMAEHQNEVTCNDFVKQLTCYNVFINKQAHLGEELGIKIKPLFAEAIDLDNDYLMKDFYQGVSVTEKHVWAGLGIERTEKEEKIENFFHQSPVVIVHGMSGQGKSCLCYQHIKKYYPIAFEISNCDSNSFSSICASVEELISGLQVPVLLYIDVIPSNPKWYALINSFVGYKNVRLLVSIREDDWHQHRAKVNSQVSFKDIYLELSKEEAENIFDELDKEGIVREGIYFNEVWNIFSDTGALLEFVYYLTHGQKLKDKIVAQWDDLTDDDKHVVSYITIANYLGGKLYRSELASIDGIDSISLARRISNMSGEFFYCDENGLISNLHPLRTKLLKDAIFENATDVFSQEALKLYVICDLEDSYLYLIRLMNEAVTVEKLICFMKNKHLSCSQLYGVVKSLIWKGAEEYEKKNQVLLLQLKEKIGSAWYLFLPLNFTEFDLNESLNKLFETLPNFTLPSDIISKFSSQDDVYCYLRQFVSNSIIDMTPVSEEDWLNAAQVAYWTKCASLSNYIKIYGGIKITSNDLDKMSTILLGFKTAGISIEGLNDIESSFVLNLRKRFFIVGWTCSENIECVVFTNYIVENDELKENFEPGTYLVKLLNLCRRAFPDKKLYCAKFGPDLILSTIDVPDVEKNISRANLPLQEMNEIRSLVSNLFKISYQESDRRTYAEEVFKRRKSWSSQISRLCKSFEAWWLKGDSGLKELSKEHEKAFALSKSAEIEKPQSSYNLLGYGDMTNVVNDSNKSNNKYIASNKSEDALDRFHHTMEEHFSSLVNFIYQYVNVMTGKSNAAPTNANLINLLEGLSNFQSSYRELFSNYIDKYEISILEENEQRNYSLLWLVWDAQLKGNNAHRPIKEVEQRYRKMKSSFVETVSSNIKSKIEESGLVSDIIIDDKTFNIEIEYNTASEYNIIQIVARNAISEVLGKYAFFSTQRLILNEMFNKIVIKPYYKSYLGMRLMLDNQLVSYNLIACLDKTVSTDENSPIPLPIEPNNKAKNKYIDTFNGFFGFFGAGHLMCDKIKQMKNLSVKTDECGQKLIRDYTDDCKCKLLSLAHEDEWICIKEWINDNDIREELDNVFSIAASFLKMLNSADDWWKMDDDLASAQMSLLNYNIQIKIMLVDKVKY
jgi:hypothetical protein